MAAACVMVGSDSIKARRSLDLAIGVLLVFVFVGLSHVQEANAQLNIQTINLSLVPVNVTALVNTAIVGSVVVPALSLNVNLPLANNALVNLTVTNLLDNASATSLVSVNANSALLISSSLISGQVTVFFGYLYIGVVFIPTALINLGL